VYDFWNGSFLGITDSQVSLTVPGHGCRVISLVTVYGDRANLLATNRHLSMGGIDLEEKVWEGREKVLTGRSKNLVAGEPYTLSLYLADGVPRDPEPAGEGLALEGTRTAGDGCLRQVTFVPKESGELRWSIRFGGEPLSMSEFPMESLALAGEPKATSSRVELSFSVRGSAPAAYRVQRDGIQVGMALEPRWIDEGLKPDREYIYLISPMGFPGQEIPLGSELVVKARTEPVPPPPPEPQVYLSDLSPLSASQGWGKLGIDVSVEGNPLRVGGETFAKGLGTHAHSEILFEIEPKYAIFTALAGVDQEAPQGSVGFKVLLDGECVFDSPVLYQGDPPLPVSIPVEGKRRLTLVVTDGGDGIHYDHADWARAGFVLKGDDASDE